MDGLIANSPIAGAIIFVIILFLRYMEKRDVAASDQRSKQDDRILQVIESNTQALTAVQTIVQFCKFRNEKEG